MTHIAELNIARAQYDLEDPRMAGFMDNLDRINAIAERSQGFVWRLKDETGNATDLPVMDDPRVVANLTVWETAEDLEHFVFNTAHKRIYDQRGDWFPKMKQMHFVMWHVPLGATPTLDEALARLDRLNKDGPSDEAFGWERLTNLKLWMSKRCA
jgi:heme-degrading monooxygenase HmoA